MNGAWGHAQPHGTRHVYIGLEMIQEYVCGGDYVSCAAGPALIREFVHGDPERYPEAAAMLTYMHELHGVPPGEPPLPATPHFVEAYHYLHDSLGSVIGLVDEDGALVERYTYDPYGKPLIEKWNAQTSTWQASAEPASGLPYSAYGNPFMWTGHRYDAAVGLYATLYRTYSPTLGRWLQRDPQEYEAGSVNFYEYIVSSPLVSVDPLGLETRVKDGPIGPPPGDYEQDKCRAAANKALNNCLKAEKSGCPGAPSKDDCFKTFSQSMDACARNQPGTHEEEVDFGWDYLDCVGRCIEKAQGQLLGSVGLDLIPAAPAGPTMLRAVGMGDVAGKAGMLTIEGTTFMNAASISWRLGKNSALRIGSKILFPVFVLDSIATATIEAACSGACAGGGANDKFK